MHQYKQPKTKLAICLKKSVNEGNMSVKLLLIFL